MKPAVAVVACLALLVAGCGSTDVAPPSASASSVPDPSPTPAANEYVDALVHTRGLGTAKADVILQSTIGSTVRDLTATGGLDLANGYGDLTWQDAAGGTFRERSNGRGLFVQTDVPSGLWDKRASLDDSDTGRVTDLLRGLGTLGSLRLDGTEVFQGITFHRYSGQAPVSVPALGQLGITGSEATAIAADAAPDARIHVTVWIDPSGRVVRVDRELDLPEAEPGPVMVRTITRLTEFSSDLDLSPPPSESVTSASAS